MLIKPETVSGLKPTVSNDSLSYSIKVASALTKILLFKKVLIPNPYPQPLKFYCCLN